MRPLGPFWKAVTTLGGMGHSRAGWRVVLGAEADLGTPFLRSLGRLATGYPCDPRCLMNHMRRIVEHGEDHFHAVCRAEKCVTVRLTRDEVAAFEIDLEALARAVLPALGMTARASEPTASHRTWRVGAYVTTAGIEVPVILSTAVMPYEIKRCLGELIASRLAPFVVLVARPDTIDADTTALLRRERCASLVLQDVVGVNEAGRFTVLRPVAAAIEAALCIAEVVAVPRSATPVPAAEKRIEPQPPPEKKNEFLRDGELWRLTFASTTVHTRNRKGFGYIETLLRSPEREFHAADLARPPGAKGKTPPLGSAGEALDPHAIAAYRSRMREIEEELEEAVENGDLGRRTALEEQRETIQHEVTAALGRGGRVRKSADDGERVRKAVAAAVTDAIESIRPHHEALARHLKASVRVGNFLAYVAESRTEWDV